jgi:hypothetical protein
MCQQSPRDVTVALQSSVEIEFGRRYQMKFVPTGLVSRLIIRMMHFCQVETYWQNGTALLYFFSATVRYSWSASSSSRPFVNYSIASRRGLIHLQE